MAEVSLDKEQGLIVHRVICAVDCGRVVNPDGATAQMEGAVTFGLSAALFGEIRFQGGATVEATFEDEPVLTFPDMPEVEVHLVPAGGDLGGIGEPGVPPVAPAVANAVAAATGRRIRRLPLLDDEGRLREP